MVNVLMLSKWHVHAADYARVLGGQPDARITCVWDADTARGEAWAKELGVPFEGDLDRALSRPDVDAVAVDTPTTDHRRVMVKAAQAGKHIFTEKALATTVADCEAIAEAVKKSGVKFCISFPALTTPLVQLAKEALDTGLLGQVNYLRIRKAHDGALRDWLPPYWYEEKDAGGGAMMDLGCHPVYTASYLLGKPARITSVFTNTCAPGGVDDNAVSVAEFENRAIAVMETSFIAKHHGECFELIGTEGAIVQTEGPVRMRTNRFGGGWYVPDTLPKPQPVAIRQWLDGIEKGTPIPFDLDKAIALTALLENAYRAEAERRTVPFG